MLIIAHRGYSGRAPENTLAAFKMALEAGAKALELDVHQTKDGRLAVIHDGDLKRVGKRAGTIARLSWSDLGAVDVGSWYGAAFADERIPSLEEALDLAQGRAQVHVELKAGSAKYPGIEDNLARVMDSRQAWPWAPVSSFDHEALKAVRRLKPQARLGYLLGSTPLSRAWQEMNALGAESLNVSVRQASALRVRQSHERGFKVFVYTVNDPKTLAKMAGLGVDGVYSNFPEI